MLAALAGSAGAAAAAADASGKPARAAAAAADLDSYRRALLTYHAPQSFQVRAAHNPPPPFRGPAGPGKRLAQAVRSCARSVRMIKRSILTGTKIGTLCAELRTEGTNLCRQPALGRPTLYRALKHSTTPCEPLH